MEKKKRTPTNRLIYLLYQGNDLVCASQSIQRLRAALEARVHNGGISYRVDGKKGNYSIPDQIRALREDWKGNIISLPEFNDRLVNGSLTSVIDGEII